jgi:hypothetical protein
MFARIVPEILRADRKRPEMVHRTAPDRPRRWNATVEGIKWLPRLIDKARMSANGSLGAYLMGHSPVDFALLKRLDITTADFVGIANRAVDDEAVLADLRTRGFDEDRVKRWSDGFEERYRILIPLWDIDEGYRPTPAVARPLVTVARIIEGPAMSIFRKLRPLA